MLLNAVSTVKSPMLEKRFAFKAWCAAVDDSGSARKKEVRLLAIEAIAESLSRYLLTSVLQSWRKKVFETLMTGGEDGDQASRKALDLTEHQMLLLCHGGSFWRDGWLLPHVFLAWLQLTLVEVAVKERLLNKSHSNQS
eukprot:TRINITY_DN4819_c2_g1_i1.p1 TRINITY_DN4819_c2_g1~~TRINITY_DN4819_c2_g1_i1.p1  ORF type:complete len:139 (-),score=26.17 TRINITY_DN4819_c2_g1_i1:98-514(-)